MNDIGGTWVPTLGNGAQSAIAIVDVVKLGITKVDPGNAT